MASSGNPVNGESSTAPESARKRTIGSRQNLAPGDPSRVFHALQSALDHHHDRVKLAVEETVYAAAPQQREHDEKLLDRWVTACAGRSNAA